MFLQKVILLKRDWEKIKNINKGENFSMAQIEYLRDLVK